MQYRCRCSSRAEERNHETVGRRPCFAKQLGRCSLKAADVGVVTNEGAVYRDPKRVHGADSVRGVTQTITRGADGFLVWNRDVSGRALASQTRERIIEYAPWNIQQLVHERNAGRAQRGILKDRRQRMSEWMPEQYETLRQRRHGMSDERSAVMRSKTRRTSSSNSSTVAR